MSKVAAVSTLSALLGFLLAFCALKTAEQIAKTSLLRIEMAQQEQTK